MTLRRIWITYAWDDNLNKDVDFIAQELTSAGLTIKLDRWNLSAGKPLWEQIARFITESSESDAWLLIATQNSLGSKACKEEFAYALDRALSTRGEDFPIIALFPSHVDSSLIPPGIKTRLYLSIEDSDWKEQIKAAAEGRAPNIARPVIDPYAVTVHRLEGYSGGRRFCIEVRPRAGTWSPTFIALPIGEKELADPTIVPGSSGRPPGASMVLGHEPRESPDGQWWILAIDNLVTPSQSCFLFCNTLPTKIAFGILDGKTEFVVKLSPPTV